MRNSALFIAFSAVILCLPVYANVDIGFDPRQSNEFKTLDDAATRYYSSQISQDWLGMSQHVFGILSAPSGKSFFWTDEIGNLQNLESIKIAEFTRFQSLDGKTSGFILFGIRKYNQNLNKNDSYFVDFWFQKNGQWWVLPKLLVFDKSHNIPEATTLGSSIFITEIEFLRNLNKAASREALRQQEESDRRALTMELFSREFFRKRG